MIWFFERIARFELEQKAIADLEQEVPWIENVNWRISDKAAICVEADIRIGEAIWAVTLTYPRIFPDSPPTVTPRDSNERWSGHQYGGGGELCLEYRPDNWHSSITGAEMLRSAYKLLSTEAGVNQTETQEVPSAHHMTLGQELRTEHYRFVLTESAKAKLACAAEPRVINLRPSFIGNKRTSFLCKLTEADGSVWTDPELPSGVSKWTFDAGFAIAVKEGDARLDVLEKSIHAGAAILRLIFIGDLSFDEDETLILSLPTGVRAFYLKQETGKVCEYAIITPDPADRMPQRNLGLGEKKVAFLGCGSLGSKAAISLARAGGRRFLLIDDDVLCPENMVRHELDWLSVGSHKADALKERLLLIAPEIEVEVRRHHLGGQESGGSLETLMEAMSKCDLIAEASGSHEGFNYAASVATSYSKPMVWARVFAGGYGGMVVRSRPGLDPEPLDVRAQIEAWCANPEFPEAPKPTANYSGASLDEQPMVADDADVSAIAAHFSRMIIDTALALPVTLFEYSAYMVGLRKEWIFRAAFDIWPIELIALAPKVEEEVTQERRENALRAILKMVPGAPND